MSRYIIASILSMCYTIGFSQDLFTELDEAFKSNDLAALEHIKQQAIQDGDKLTLAEAHYRIGYIKKKEEQFFDAVIHYQEAIKAYREIGEYNQLSSVLIHLADTYSLSGFKQTALDYYRDVIKLKIQLSDSIGLMRSYYNIGKVYKDFNKADTALTYYNRSLQLASIFDKKYMGRIYNDMGTLYRKEKEYETARHYYDLADQYDTSIVMQARTLNNRGYSYLEEDNTELALRYLKQALQLDPTKVQARTLSFIYGNLGEIQLKPDSALFYHEKSFQYLKDRPLTMTAEYFETSKKLRKLYETIGDIDKVADHYALQDKLTEDLINLQSELRSMALQYQVEAATWKIERDHKTEELKAQNRLLLYALLGLFITSAGLVIYFLRVREHQKKEQHIARRAKEVYDILQA